METRTPWLINGQQWGWIYFWDNVAIRLEQTYWPMEHPEPTG